MPLNALDLSAMERIEREQANRRLTCYLCETLAAVIPRIPSKPDCMQGLVNQAGVDATVAGYDQGKPYSSHITLSVLLGLHWERDPTYAQVALILEDPGMEQDVRLDMAVNTAIKLRRQLESVQCSMHEVTLDILSIPSEKLGHDAIWSAFQRLAALRGVLKAAEVLQLFMLYEADAYEFLGLAPIKRKVLTAYEYRIYQEMGLPVPQPTEDLHGVARTSLVRLTHHLLLAASFGRFYHLNPLLKTLHRALDEVTNLPARSHALATFLRQHQNVLMEAAHG
ncbi:hypothetical protein [Pseudomonas protegens]|uniref:hypothetical protein n=1 Tax=Pseudomonas protegens TaxID=380021 RepID=UPI000641F4A3|nr:hypothetical protein [Pseudomonas protegens]